MICSRCAGVRTAIRTELQDIVREVVGVVLSPVGNLTPPLAVKANVLRPPVLILGAKLNVAKAVVLEVAKALFVAEPVIPEDRLSSPGRLRGESTGVRARQRQHGKPDPHAVQAPGLSSVPRSRSIQGRS